MTKIRVTGYIYPEAHEIDPDHDTGLTADAFDDWFERLASVGGIDDLNFERDDS